MSTKEHTLHDGKKGTAIAVRVIPRAAANEIVEITNDGVVKIRLQSSGENEEINHVLLSFLETILRVPVNNIEVVAGVSSRSKLISILNLDSETCHQRILANIA